MAQILLLVLPFLVMWWFLIRPQRQRVAEQRQIMANVGEGDQIITASGIYGIVTDTDDESLYVEIADGVEIRLSRGAVGRLIDVEEGDWVDEGQGEADDVAIDLDAGPGDDGVDQVGEAPPEADVEDAR